MSRYKTCTLATFCLLATFAPWNVRGQISGCEKAQSTAEQADCVNHQLSIVEDEMKHAFDRALEMYTSKPEDQKANPVLPKSEEKEQLKWEEGMRRRLNISQKAWLAYRESSCETVREMYEGGTAASVAVPLCKVDITKARIEFLHSNFGDEH